MWTKRQAKSTGNLVKKHVHICINLKINLNVQPEKKVSKFDRSIILKTYLVIKSFRPGNHSVITVSGERPTSKYPLEKKNTFAKKIW